MNCCSKSFASLLLAVLIVGHVSAALVLDSSDRITGASNISFTGFLSGGSIFYRNLTGFPTQVSGDDVIVGGNGTAWFTKDLFSASGFGAIREVNTPEKYLYGGATFGSVNLYFNETVLNATIDSRDTNTLYTAGTGLVLASTEFSLDGSHLNMSIDARAPSYTAGSCLELSSGVFSFNASCNTDTTYTASTGLVLSGSAFSVNETYLNTTVQKWGITSNCTEGQFVTGASYSTVYCDTPSGAGTITSVYGDVYITGGSSSGDVTLTFNETLLNQTIDSRDTDTTYVAGECMLLSGNEFSFNTTCNTGTEYSAGEGLVLSSTVFSVNSTYLTNLFVSRSDWTTIDNYPEGCPEGQAVRTIGDTLTCIEVGSGGGSTSYSDVCIIQQNGITTVNASCGSGDFNVTGQLIVGTGLLFMNDTVFIPPGAFEFQGDSFIFSANVSAVNGLFTSVYGTTFYENGASLSSTYASLSHVSSLTNNVTANQHNISEHATNLTDHEGRITALENAGGSGYNDTLLWTNASVQEGHIITLYSNASDQQTHIMNLWSNASAQEGHVTLLYANASTQEGHINTLYSNASSQETHVTNLWTNASGTHTHINNLWTNASVQETHIGNVWTNLSAVHTHVLNLWSNASTQESHITTLWSNASAQQGHINTLWENASSQESHILSLWSNASTQEAHILDLWSNASSQLTKFADYLPLAGGVMTGNINITNIHAPDNGAIIYGGGAYCEYWNGTHKIEEAPCAL